jgi:hypothetical protein
MLMGTGTFFLIVRLPTVLIGLGMAIFAYAAAFKTGFMRWHRLRQTASLSSFKTMFRVYSSANLVAACLSGIGCVIYGGPVGVLGAFVALYWFLMNLWFLKRFTRDEASEDERASTS